MTPLARLHVTSRIRLPSTYHGLDGDLSSVILTCKNTQAPALIRRMDASMNRPSSALQFVGVVGVAFLLIMLLFGVSLGIRRYVPKHTSRDSERGLPVPAEVSPLLPEPTLGTSSAVPDDYDRSSYGATAVASSPADARTPSKSVKPIEIRESPKDRSTDAPDDAGRATGSVDGQSPAEESTSTARPGSHEHALEPSQKEFPWSSPHVSNGSGHISSGSSVTND